MIARTITAMTLLMIARTITMTLIMIMLTTRTVNNDAQLVPSVFHEPNQNKVLGEDF